MDIWNLFVKINAIAGVLLFFSTLFLLKKSKIPLLRAIAYLLLCWSAVLPATYSWHQMQLINDTGIFAFAAALLLMSISYVGNNTPQLTSKGASSGSKFGMVLLSLIFLGVGFSLGNFLQLSQDPPDPIASTPVAKPIAAEAESFIPYTPPLGSGTEPSGLDEVLNESEYRPSVERLLPYEPFRSKDVRFLRAFARAIWHRALTDEADLKTGRPYIDADIAKRAEGVVRYALEIEPNNSELTSDLAYVLYIQSKDREARAALDSLMTVTPAPRWYYVNNASLTQAEKGVEAAARQFERALFHAEKAQDDAVAASAFSALCRTMTAANKSHVLRILERFYEKSNSKHRVSVYFAEALLFHGEPIRAREILDSIPSHQFYPFMTVVHGASQLASLGVEFDVESGFPETLSDTDKSRVATAYDRMMAVPQFRFVTQMLANDHTWRSVALLPVAGIENPGNENSSLAVQAAMSGRFELAQWLVQRYPGLISQPYDWETLALTGIDTSPELLTAVLDQNKLSADSLESMKSRRAGCQFFTCEISHEILEARTSK